MALSPGQDLGAYTLGALIGAGGMGEVYRARDARLGRDIAIKVLPPALATDPERLRRFEQEARAAAALNHPGIITIHSVERAGEIHFLTMELVEGNPLKDVIPPKGLPLPRLVDIAAGLADALGTAHAHGIVHRDLKPANVMVTREGRTKILDFGLAKLRPTTNASELTTHGAPPPTTDGQLLGTVAYMSPEQAEGREIDHRSDVFSLGVVLFELATGERPFQGDSSAAVLSSLMRDTPSVADRRPDVPRDLARIIQRCLAKPLDRRYQSVIDLRNDLEQLKTDLAAGSAGSSLNAAPDNAKRLRTFAWAAGSLAAVAAVAMVFLSWRGAIDLGRITGAPPAPVLTTSVSIPLVLPEEARGLRGLAVSPDGSHVTFAGGKQLWLYTVKTGDLRAVPGVDGHVDYPFWSPDGRFIAYFTTDALMKIPAAGGVSDKVCNVKSSLGGAWGADNTILVAAGSIFRTTGDGGPLVPFISDGSGGTGLIWPHFLPDGRHFTYLATGTPPVVHLASLDTGEPNRELKQVTSQAFAVSEFLFTAEGPSNQSRELRARPFGLRRGELAEAYVSIAAPLSTIANLTAAQLFAASPTVLAYSTRAERSYQFSVVDPSHGAPQALGPPLSRLFTEVVAGEYSWSFSPVPRWTVAFTARESNGRPVISLLDLRSMEPPTLFEPGQNPIWASTGDEIAFGSPGLVSRRLDSENRRTVKPLGLTPNVPHDWQAGVLLFDDQTERVPKIWVADGKGSPKAWLPSTNDSRQAASRLSPDGEWVAYEEGPPATAVIYLRRLSKPDEIKVAVSPPGASLPRWRPDGKAVFYRINDTLTEVELDIGATVKPQRPREVLKLGESLGYAVLPGGKQFLLFQPIGPTPPQTITIVVNWPALVSSSLSKN